VTRLSCEIAVRFHGLTNLALSAPSRRRQPRAGTERPAAHAGRGVTQSAWHGSPPGAYALLADPQRPPVELCRLSVAPEATTQSVDSMLTSSHAPFVRQISLPSTVCFDCFSRFPPCSRLRPRYRPRRQTRRRRRVARRATGCRTCSRSASRTCRSRLTSPFGRGSSRSASPA
jgi:hypothetical protein